MGKETHTYTDTRPPMPMRLNEAQVMKQPNGAPVVQMFPECPMPPSRSIAGAATKQESHISAVVTLQKCVCVCDLECGHKECQGDPHILAGAALLQQSPSAPPEAHRPS